MTGDGFTLDFHQQIGVGQLLDYQKGGGRGMSLQHFVPDFPVFPGYTRQSDVNDDFDQIVLRHSGIGEYGKQIAPALPHLRLESRDDVAGRIDADLSRDDHAPRVSGYDYALAVIGSRSGDTFGINQFQGSVPGLIGSHNCLRLHWNGQPVCILEIPSLTEDPV